MVVSQLSEIEVINILVVVKDRVLYNIMVGFVPFYGTRYKLTVLSKSQYITYASL